MTELYLVRHGQTLGNVMGISQGTTNTEIAFLNDHGKQQIETLQRHFDISFADRLISSPLVRTQQTATILNQQAQLPVSEDARLLEISYGQWDGQKKTVLRAKYPTLFSDETGDVIPAYAPVAHGERLSDVEARVDAFMNDALEQFPDERLIIVTHGFTIRSFVVAALKVLDPFAVPEPANGSVTKITLVPENGRRMLNYFHQCYEENPDGK